MIRASQTLVKLFEELLCSLSCSQSSAERQGIRKLPDEILSVIMDHAVSSFDEARDLSHVCSWFRTVAISSPEIWRKIPLSFSLTTNEARTIVQRSQGNHLKAYFDTRSIMPYPGPLLEHIVLVTPTVINLSCSSVFGSAKHS